MEKRLTWSKISSGKTSLEAAAVIQARNDVLETRITVEMEKGRLIQEIKWEGEQMELLMK